MKLNIRKLAGYTMVAMLATTVALFGISRTASAEKFQGLNVSPSSATYDLKNGETKTGTFNVRNTTDSDMPVKISVGSYVIKDNNYNAPLYDSSSTAKYGLLQKWIVVDQTNFTLKPDQSRDVNYAIFAPANPPAGSQYASILVATDHAEKEGVVNGVGRWAFVIKANMVDGQTNAKASIIDKKISSYQPTDSLKASFKVKNEGNVGASLKYQMKVTSALGGKEVYTGTKMSQSTDVYPESTRSIVATSDKLGIGFYNVEMTVELNGQTETFKQLVCNVPVWIFILIIVAIVCLVVYFVAQRQDSKKSSKKSSSKKSSKRK